MKFTRISSIMVLGVFLALISLLQCNPDEGPLPEPVNPFLLDSTPVSYSQEVLKVLNSGNCLGCHSDEVKQGNISLEGHENFKTIAESETLLKAIKHEPGAVPMPLDRDKLPIEKIAIIERWAAQGFKNN